MCYIMIHFLNKEHGLYAEQFTKSYTICNINIGFFCKSVIYCTLVIIYINIEFFNEVGRQCMWDYKLCIMRLILFLAVGNHFNRRYDFGILFPVGQYLLVHIFHVWTFRLSAWDYMGLWLQATMIDYCLNIQFYLSYKLIIQ